jgi:calcium-dependent protein kinase
LIDFGLSKIRSGDQMRSEIAGTGYYMAPELFL